MGEERAESAYEWCDMKIQRLMGPMWGIKKVKNLVFL